MTYTVEKGTLSASLDGSHSAAYTADVFYDGVPTILDLPVTTDGSISINGDSRVQTTARLYVRSDKPVLDRDGHTLAPDDASDFLAPFGQEVSVTRSILLGQTVVGSVMLARLRITEVPTISATRKRLRNSKFVDTVSVELSLSDQFDRIDGDLFSEPTGPLAGATTWSEIRRISPIPVQSAINDETISRKVVYPENRLDAITLLLSNIGAVPHLTRGGVLTARPAAPMDVAGYVVTDMTGTIQDQTRSLSNDFHNFVVVNGASSGSKQVLGSASVGSGPLSITGPMGRRVLTVSNPLATSNEAANASARTYLAKELASQARKVTVTCLPRMDLEAGDVVKVTDPASGRVETGTVASMQYSLNPTDLMQVDVTVPQGV